MTAPPCNLLSLLEYFIMSQSFGQYSIQSPPKPPDAFLPVSESAESAET